MNFKIFQYLSVIQTGTEYENKKKKQMKEEVRTVTVKMYVIQVDFSESY